jgi:hypothetical protein
MAVGLATPWVEQGTIKMDLDEQKLEFGFKEKFDAEAVKEALKGQRFPNAEMLAGP